MAPFVSHVNNNMFAVCVGRNDPLFEIGMLFIAYIQCQFKCCVEMVKTKTEKAAKHSIALALLSVLHLEFCMLCVNMLNEF